MSTFKRADVVMLHANTKSPIGFPTDIDLDYKKLKFGLVAAVEGSHPMHIYIVNDDDINVGDWYYAGGLTRDYSIQKCNSERLRDVIREGRNKYGIAKKVIATTDLSLNTSEQEPEKWISAGGQGGQLSVHWHNWRKSGLPQLSKSFLNKFVETHNQGNLIQEVLVEYELLCCQTGRPCGFPCNGDCGVNGVMSLKVSDKDHTITIKKLKTSWSREEVIELLGKFGEFADYLYRPYTRNNMQVWENKDNWIKENL